MNRVLAISLIAIAFAAGAFAADVGLVVVTTTASQVRLSKPLQLKWAAGEHHTITLDSTVLVDYTVPSGMTFTGNLNFDGRAQ